MLKEDNKDNDWAKDIKGNYVYINDVEKGLKGYYCLGCGGEMLAVKGNMNKHHFRHHAKDVNRDIRECLIANRQYREKIAKSILNRLKSIKVPRLFKYPPKEVEGSPMLLKEIEIIKAAYTKAELTFYETEEGNIKWGKNPDIDKRYLLIRPDVVFFDKENNPILFVEFVITHKVPPEKIVKLHRIGINSVQIIIPKTSEEEIEKTLKSSRKFKWIYNEVEANTNYIPVSKGSSETILSIDEEQRGIFQKSFSCISTEINGLIRVIKKCIQSEQYRGTKQLFESEISRVEKNRKREEQRLEEMERDSREEAYKRNRVEEERVRSRYRRLEARYNKKREKLESRRSEIENSFEAHHSDYRANENFQRKIERKESEIKRIEELKDKILREGKLNEERIRREVQNDFDKKIEREKSEIKRIDGDRDNVEERIGAEIEREIRDIERKIQYLRFQEETVEGSIFEEFREKIEFEEAEIDRFKREEENFEGKVREEFDREVENSPGKLTKRIRDLLEVRTVICNYNDTKFIEEGYKITRELLKKGAI
ncbi:hypothetical protein [Tenacibaculum maritimum]|uniref:hypothetical protein n=1 Tax=Tenacibaculum maritimum TaxID=107401 RepID=UPI001E40C247|nr:hypothetical protein [Tenacibaculum maritimum]MCD9586233.1 hypothetical protein [Tenacibaculum maritimum]MCD9622194.1 hypothetical protein [Tenacibaculum maritimum]MCD9628619.1 hypothetical protein [Tenacibaculum maritimum]MCD9631507.1 hypothetical protein [Tenacibaculum maritimum]MCD9634404.1 hypothetical protein [Tenacibaculum maritimum]